MKRFIKFSKLTPLIFLVLTVIQASALGRYDHVMKGEDEPPKGSTVYESLIFYSDILGRDVEYCVYLPKGYEESTVNCPVLYLLHGYSDDETGWVQFGQVQMIADNTIDEFKASQMIIVMPDAGVTWYVNTSDEEEAYEDFLIKEFIAHIDEGFRTRPERQFRAVAGLSMGGFGALMLGLRHPDLFSSVGALSAGVFTDEEVVSMDQGQWDELMGLPFGKGLEGEARLEGNYKQYSLPSLIDAYKNMNNETRFYIDCGDDDFLILGNLELHALMIQAEIPHEFRVRDGRHTWSYWRTALPSVLTFISEDFHR